jgi:hypothetical protein
LINRLGKPNWPIHLLMDRAYEGNETRQQALARRLVDEFLEPPRA